MASVARRTKQRTRRTAVDLVARLGDIPLSRILVDPPPGTATETDLIAACEQDTLCELVDGILVEKAMGFEASFIAVELIRVLHNYLQSRPLGFLLGPDAQLRVLAPQVRLPDVSFFSWKRFPGRKRPRGVILGMSPDLAVEVLSPGNTEQEMARKAKEYFAGGTKLVWIIDPQTRTAEVHTSARRKKTLDESGLLEGGKVLPGFRLSLAELFASLPEEE